MQLDIRGKGLPLTPSLRTHVERRLRFALGRFVGSLTRVSVSVGDINGPRGGVDKRCRVQMHLGRKTRLLVDELDADLYVAIDRAAERAGRAFERAVARQRGLGA